ncbi:isochorismatase family protein [Actinomadura rupiterrae]|uniref:isochorismatase family protein n=1 Tax=Actinomadura rupiterrae TaxID=559627 RepID=UPI0020A296EC|nr:isochorismatase family protein [Actinomadura rupiterrae]MCP2337993.1 nicotinamidase-related amidase [Actinomadura rupiterrae]
MTFQRYDADTALLLLVDHQVGIVERVQYPSAETVRRNAVALAKAAREVGMPIVLTSSIEKDNGPLLPGLAQAVPQAHADRTERPGTVDALDHPSVAAALKAADRTTIITAGVGSEVCGVWPALHAAADGFQVHFVADACGSMTQFGHETTLRRLQQSGITVTTTATVISGLVENFTTPRGTALLQILRGA